MPQTVTDFGTFEGDTWLNEGEWPSPKDDCLVHWGETGHVIETNLCKKGGHLVLADACHSEGRAYTPYTLPTESRITSALDRRTTCGCARCARWRLVGGMVSAALKKLGRQFELAWLMTFFLLKPTHKMSWLQSRIFLSLMEILTRDCIPGYSSNTSSHCNPS